MIKNTKAFILAAGLGTRLQPYTENTPKALVRLNNKPLLQHIIEKFIRYGIHDFVINIHHFGNQIIDFLEKHNDFDCNIKISDERKQLLDTGGGLKFAQPYLDTCDFFFMHNVDIISNIDLLELYKTHIEYKALATLAIRNRKTSRYLLFNKKNKLIGWENTKTGELIKINNEEKSTPFGFSGIQVLSKEIFNQLPVISKYSITPEYIKLAKKFNISGYNHTNDVWYDVGKPEQLEEAEIFIKKNNRDKEN